FSRDWSSDVCSSDLHASQIIASYRAALGLELPDASELAALDPASARRIRFLAGRVVDGERLRIAVESNDLPELPATIDGSIVARSEERRGGEGWRSR